MKIKKKNGKHVARKTKVSAKALDGVYGGATRKKATKKKASRKVSRYDSTL